MSAVQDDRPWTADAGDGTYRNPVLNADWSDPDVVRVGEDFYLTASSFGRVPGLPLLHSRDLVNWSIVGHALDRLEPAADFAVPRHDRGVGAVAAAPRRTVLDLLGRPRPRHPAGQRREHPGPVDRAPSAEGGQGADRRLPAVGRGDWRGVSRARLGQVPLRHQEPAHRPPDERGRPGAARRGQDPDRRRHDPRLVHPGGPQALPAQRRVLDPRPGRRGGDGLAGRLPLPRLLRTVRGTSRPRPGPYRGQRTAPGRLGPHGGGRGLVPALPAARRVRQGRPPPADALGRGGRRLAGHR